VIVLASRRSLERIDPPLVDILRVASYQLLFLERVAPHAAVHEAVEDARAATHRGGAGFVNAVLRRIAASPHRDAWPVDERDPLRRLAIETSHPDLLVQRWPRRLGAERTRRLLHANNRPKPLHLLAFRDHDGRDGLMQRLREEGCEVESSLLAPLGVVVRSGRPMAGAAFAAGDCYVQDEASQAAALLPWPTAGERLLDVAAAPGGKSFAAIAVEPSVQPTMVDLSLQRLLVVRRNLARLRRSAALVAADATAPAFATGWQRIVVDLPCSGTGTLRRHPELKWRLSAEEIERLAAAGLRLASASATLLAVGGCMSLITCSLEPEENEALVEKLLVQSPELELLVLEQAIESRLRDALETPQRWRLWTGADHDGFTVHVVRRSR